MRRFAKHLALVGLLVAFVAACGDDSGSSSSSSSTASAASGSNGAAVAITKAWARSTAASAKNGAVYFIARAKTADALTGASVDPSVAAKVEVHETMGAGGAMGSGSTMGGSSEEMKMVPVERIDLPEGTDVALKPGGYHVMLLDLAKPLEKGTTINVTLTFAKSGAQTISVPVRDDAP